MNTENLEAAETTEDRILRLEQLVIERTKLKEEETAVKERLATIDAILLRDLDPGTHPIAGVKVQIRNGAKRLDTASVEKAFPFTQHPELYSAKLDTTKVKDHIAPIHLDQYYRAGSPTVVVS